MGFPAEIDIANVRQADDALHAVLARQPAILVVDMTATRFCDSTGIAALLRARKRAAALHIALRLAGPGDSVIRVLRVAGADRLLDIYPSVSAALSGGPGPA